jgi:hypothetical protein
MGKNSLFQVNDVSVVKSNKLEASYSTSEIPKNIIQINSKASQLLSKLFNELNENTHIDFVTSGELSLHQIIQYAVTLTENCDVYISSWAVKEEPARVLYFLKQTEKIKNLYGVFDYRIKTLDAKHFQLIEKAFTAYALTKNHSKVIVIESDKLNLVIVSSANLSNNPRIECGFISTIDKTVQFHKQWMTDVLNGKTVY